MNEKHYFITWVTCVLAQSHQLIFSFSLFNSLLQWRICLPNSSAVDNFCNNIIVSHFCLHLSCYWKMTAQLFGSKVHCLCRHLRALPNLPTWNFFWKSSMWSQQAKNHPDWTSFKLQGEQTSKEQVAKIASSEPGFRYNLGIGASKQGRAKSPLRRGAKYWL